MPDTVKSATPADELETNVVAQGDTEAVEVQADAKPDAPSSDGADTEAKSAERKSLLDVVKDAAKPKADRDTSNPGTSKGTTASADPKTVENDDPSKDKYDDPKLPFHKHPRWVELRAELKAAKEVAGKAETAFKQHEAAVKRDATINEFMSRNQLEPDHMVQLFRMGALIRNRPEEALKELRQLVTEIEADLGEQLPADIQAAVENGELTEKRAYELAKARATAKVASAETERVREASAEQAAQAGQQQLMTNLGNEVLAFEKAKRASDPDFELKYPEIQKLVRLRSQARLPKNAAEGRQYMEDAYKQVSDIMSAARPKPRPTGDRQPRTSSAPVNQDTAAPKTLADAVRRGLRTASQAGGAA